MPAPCMPISTSVSCIRVIASRRGMAKVVTVTFTSQPCSSVSTISCSLRTARLQSETGEQAVQASSRTQLDIVRPSTLHQCYFGSAGAQRCHGRDGNISSLLGSVTSKHSWSNRTRHQCILSRGLHAKGLQHSQCKPAPRTMRSMPSYTLHNIPQVACRLRPC